MVFIWGFMALTTRYNVYAYHKITGPAERQAKSMERAFSGVARMAKRVALLLGAGFAIHKIKGIVGNMLSLNEQLESMRVGMGAAMVSAQVFDNINDAVAATPALLKKLETAAVISPGTFSQFATLSNTILPFVAQASNGFDDMEKNIVSMATQGITAGKALGIGFDDIANSMALIMAGTARAQTPLWRFIRMPVAKELGIPMKKVTEEFNKLDAATRMATLQKVLGPFASAGIKYSRTWAGLTSTTQDYIEIIQREFGKPLFEKVKSDIARVVDWLEAHRNAVFDSARAIGDNLVSAYERAKKAASWMWEHKAQIAAGGIAVGAAKAATPSLIAAGASAAGAITGPSQVGIGIMAGMAIKHISLLARYLLHFAIIAAGVVAVVWLLVNAITAAWTASDYWRIQIAQTMQGISAAFSAILGIFVDDMDASKGAIELLGNSVLSVFTTLLQAVKPLLIGFGYLVMAISLIGRAMGALAATIHKIFEAVDTRSTKPLEDIKGIWQNWNQETQSQLRNFHSRLDTDKMAENFNKKMEKQKEKESLTGARGKKSRGVGVTSPKVKIDKIEFKIDAAQHPERVALGVKKVLERMSNQNLYSPAGLGLQG